MCDGRSSTEAAQGWVAGCVGSGRPVTFSVCVARHDMMGAHCGGRCMPRYEPMIIGVLRNQHEKLKSVAG